MARHTAVVLEIVHRPTHPGLREHVVRGYWGYRELGAPLRRAELPHAGVVLIVNLGPSIEVDGARLGSFIAGLHDRPAITEHHGEQAGVQLNLTPVGGLRLLGMPMRELTREVVAVDEALGRTGAELTERMADMTAWRDRFALLDDFLLRRLRVSAPVRPDVAYAWSRLASTHGDLAIGQLCRELQVPRRPRGDRLPLRGLRLRAPRRLRRRERRDPARRAAPGRGLHHARPGLRRGRRHPTRGDRLHRRRGPRRPARPGQGGGGRDREGPHRPGLRLTRVRGRGPRGNVWSFGTYRSTQPAEKRCLRRRARRLTCDGDERIMRGWVLSRSGTSPTTCTAR